MKYVTLKLIVEEADPFFLDVRPEMVSDIKDHMLAGCTVTMCHGEQYHVDGSREQTRQVLESDGDEAQKRMLATVREMIDGVGQVLVDTIKRVEALERK